MPIYVSVLPVDGTIEVKNWCESSSTAPVLQDEWEDLAIKLIQGNFGEQRLQVEVFLCLYGAIEELYNYGRLAETLRYAREHVWGSPVHVVIGVNFRLQPDQWKYQPTWVKFFETLHQAKIIDLIENPTLFDRSFPTGSQLRVLADAASERRKRLEGWLANQGWMCVVRPQTDAPLADFLKPFVTQDTTSGVRSNRIIVCNNSRQSTSKTFIQKNTAHGRSGQQFVANLVPDLSFHRWLVEECRRRSLEVVEFRGALELRFLLMRLNQFDQYGPVGNQIESVSVSSQPLFTANKVANPPRLLITNAFDPSSQRDYMLCLEAADEAGGLKHSAPAGTTTEIYQSVTCERLPAMIESGIVTVWVYQGHGDGANGLQESRAGKLAHPYRWLECFSDYNGSLPLVVFSACRSSTIARLFAEAGAGVAIGFDSDVTSSAAKLLTIEVVSTALRTGGDRGEILDAFARGCRRLTARGYMNSGPRAFWASRPDHAV